MTLPTFNGKTITREEWAGLAPADKHRIRLEHLSVLLSDRPAMIEPSRLQRYYGDSKPYECTEGIAVISIVGAITNDESYWRTSYREIQRQVADAATDQAVKAILLQVDSPGGETDGAFETADDIEAAAALKPVWGCADPGAYSAGYLLLSAASVIYAPPQSGGVGSIGVIARHIDYSKYLEAEGVTVTSIFSGDRKDDFSPYKPLSEDARKVLEAEVTRLSGLFVDTVARRRKMSTDAVRATQAGLFFGADAISSKLADRPGMMRDALAALRAEITQPTKLFGAAASAANLKEGRPMAEPQSPATNAVDVEKVRTDAEAQGHASACEIVDLCAIAGKPALAAEFLAKKVTVADVRKKLLEAKAEGQAETEINSQLPAGAGREGAGAGNPNLLAERMAARFAKGGKS